MIRMDMRRIVAVAGLTAFIAVAAIVNGPHAVQAQQTGGSGLPSIWTTQAQYRIGDPIEYCYRIPSEGTIILTFVAADGTSRVMYNGGSAGTGACQLGNTSGPPGQVCLRLTYPQPAGDVGTVQTCFDLIAGTSPLPPLPPQPPVNNLAITTDRTQYSPGDTIQYCYTVPSAGFITVVMTPAGGASQTVLSGFDDGSGGCRQGTIIPPAGSECLTLTYVYSTGAQASAQTCYLITGPSPGADWTFLGAAQVDGNGNWSFNQPLVLDPALTRVRVTSGDCNADPAFTLVWESTLQRQTGLLGADVWIGNLAPVGLAVSSGGVGFARIERPVTFNPQSQVDLTLFGVGTIYTGTTLSACLHRP
jgi:hypothetical protein